jgi:hypothetical protein
VRPTTPHELPGLDDAIGKAHGIDAWKTISTVQADIVVELDGTTLIEGSMLYDPHGNRVRMDLAGDTTLVFDGERAWVSPATDVFRDARFHLLTWPYFLAAPFKLGDHGANLSGVDLATLQGKAYRTAKLTFDPGTGDTPEDWFLVYADLSMSKLGAMGYINTYGTTVEQAQVEPRAITYHDFGIFNDVVLGQRWQLWSWNEQEGISGDPLGQVRLANIRFPGPMDEAFERPADAREDKLPAPR